MYFFFCLGSLPKICFASLSFVSVDVLDAILKARRYRSCRNDTSFSSSKRVFSSFGRTTWRRRHLCRFSKESSLRCSIQYLIKPLSNALRALIEIYRTKKNHLVGHRWARWDTWQRKTTGREWASTGTGTSRGK